MLLATKFFIPHTHTQLTARPRLWAKLAGSAPERLCLLAAPAGFGKTMLVAEWITARQLAQQIAWLALDEEDNDPVRFLTYLIGALQRVDPGLGQSAQALLATPQPPAPSAILTMLINEIGAAAKSIIVVLDDYHLITTPAIHEAIIFLVEQMPANLRLIITSRADPPFPLARWRVRRHLSELRAGDLRFTQAELAQFLEQELSLVLPTPALTALEQRTEGWIAGIQLATLSLQGQADPTAFIAQFTGSHSYIIDYLVEEVLQQQPPAVQRFLQQTAILTRLCGDLCDRVMDDKDSQSQLEALHRANLFLIPLDHERRWYRYHHLFAEMLQKWLRQQAGASVPTLHRRACTWYEEQGLLLDAIHHALAAGDQEHAASLLERMTDALRKRGEFVTLATLLNRLPDGLLQTRPRLALARANALAFHHQLDEAGRWLMVSEQANAAADPTIRGNIAAIRTDIALNRGELAGAIQLAQEALAYLPADDGATRSFVMLLEGIAHFWSYDYTAALASYEAGVQLAKRAGSLLITIYTLAAKVEVLQRQGRLHEAAATLQTIFDDARSHGIEQSALLGSSLVVMGELCYEWNDLDRAEQYLTQSLARAQEAQNPRTQLHVYSSLLRVASARRQATQCQATIQAAEALIQQFQLPPQMVNDFRIGRWRVALQANDRELVAAQVQAWQQQHGSQMAADSENFDLLRARLLLAQADYPAALPLLQEVYQSTLQRQHRPHQVEALALMALAHAGSGDQAQAAKVIQPLLDTAQPAGFIRTIVDAGATIYELLKQNAEHHSTDPMLAAQRRAYLDKLLAAFPGHAAPATPLPAAALNTALVEPLSEREWEVLRLVDQGFSNTQIADRLIITVGTVKRHLNNIFGKLGVGSRTEALARARILQLL